MGILLVTLLFVIFALIHSVCVMDRAKGLAVRLFGELLVRAFYRFLFTCLSVVSLVILVYLVMRIPNKVLYVLPLPAKVLFYLFQAAGAAMVLLAFRHIDLFEFLGIKQVIAYLKTGQVGGDTEGMSGTGLITTGIYAVVRHPLYVGGFLMVTFNPHLSVNMVTFAVLADIYVILGSFIEERRLLARFGEAYRRYCQEVPRFIPGRPAKVRDRGR